MLEAILMVVVGITAAMFLHILLINTIADRVAASICVSDIPYEQAKRSVKRLYRLFYALLTALWLVVMKITWYLLS